MFFGNMAEGAERWRWWRRQTGKQHIEECWDVKDLWGSRWGTKEEEMATGWFMGIHPLYFPMDRIRSWICDDLVEKYGEVDGKSCPSFLTQAFRDRMVEIFTWWGKKGALDEVKEALEKLPIHVEEPKIEGQSSKTEAHDVKRRTKRGKVAPEVPP
jgi:hypothetical protein